MLVRNVRIDGKGNPVDIRIHDGKFEKIAEHLEPEAEEAVIEGNGKMILPPFVEPHVHLDTCYTAGDPDWNHSGTLFEGIDLWSKRKQKLTPEDIRERVYKAVRNEVSNGVQFIRTHVDMTDPDLVALKTMIQLREELKDIVTIQIVAFPQEGILSYRKIKCRKMYFCTLHLRLCFNHRPYKAFSLQGLHIRKGLSHACRICEVKLVLRQATGRTSLGAGLLCRNICIS